MAQVGEVILNSPPSKEKKGRCWCFTKFAIEDTIDTVFLGLRGNLERTDARYVAQVEVAPNTGTEHIQGCVQFKNARSFKSVKELLGDDCHIEKCRKWKDSIKYCSKLESRKAGEVPYAHGVDLPDEIIDRFDMNKLQAWQAFILDQIKAEPDLRTVNWIYDETGGSGKTLFCKHLKITMGDEVLYCSGKTADIAYAIAQKKKKPKIILMDVPRCNKDYVNYHTIEKLKDGIFFSPKYESTEVIMNSPWIWVFANEPPNREKLSADRWRIMEITPLGTLLFE